MTTRIDWAKWHPDPREVYEERFCRVRNVYRIRTSRQFYFCDQCGAVIAPKEQYDSVAVAGCGVAGFTHPRKIHCHCRKAFIDKMNQKYAEAYGLILQFCGWCDIYKGHLDARGNPGLSHGICGPCADHLTNHCKHCNGILIEAQDEPDRQVCIACAAPHTLDGEIVRPVLVPAEKNAPEGR